MKEGFYEVYLPDKKDIRNKKILCYLYQEAGEMLADLSTGERSIPVLYGERVGPYILDDCFEPIDPTKHVTNALDLVKFVFTNSQRLERSRRSKESSQIVGESDIPF